MSWVRKGQKECTKLRRRSSVAAVQRCRDLRSFGMLRESGRMNALEHAV